MKKYIWSLLLISIIKTAAAQTVSYTTANAHAHNDYEHPVPFYTAYNKHFGSIEADVFERDGRLFVAHEARHIDTARTLEKLYLQPLQAMLRKFRNTRLQLLIDFKTAGTPTMQALVRLLQQYPDIINNPLVSLVISGNQPPPEQWQDYPSYILFDGKQSQTYTDGQLQRIPLFSYSFTGYSKWSGKGNIPAADKQQIQSLTDSIHRLHKKVRFWAAPDNPTSWKLQMDVSIDYIGTDKVEALADFLNSRSTAVFRPAQE